MNLINHVLRFLLAQLSLKPRIVHHYETHTVMQNNVEEKQSIQMWLSSPQDQRSEIYGYFISTAVSSLLPRAEFSVRLTKFNGKLTSKG